MIVGPVSLTLLLDALLAFAATIIYGYVASITATRSVTSMADRRASRFFATWWAALALTVVTGGGASLLGAFGVLDLTTHVLLQHLSLAPLAVALAALAYYLVYVHTGDERIASVAAVLHVGLLGILVWLVWAARPIGVTAGTWDVRIVNARPLEGARQVFAFALLLGPTLLAALAYAGLAFRVKDRTARFRVAMVSGGFILWFGASFVGGIGLDHVSWWPLASRLVGLAATAMILAAYHPPRMLRERFGIRQIAHDDDASLTGPAVTLRRRTGRRAVSAAAPRAVVTAFTTRPCS